MGRTFAILVLGGLSGACIAAEETSPGVHESAIYHGERARGQEGTVRVGRWTEGFNYGSCSGTVIAPRVVVTARHCVDGANPLDIVVQTGREGELGQFGVAEVRTTDGELLDDNDVGLLLMQDRIDVPGVPWARAWEPLVDAPLTLVGYGLTDDSFIGMKYVGETAVAESWPRYLRAHGTQNSCYGDSGGTALDAGGTLVGIITHHFRGPDPEDSCEGADTGLNRVDAWAAMIEQAVADATVCEAEEICGDAIDDDCDGSLDGGCTRLGEPCTTPAQCDSGDCRALGTGPAVCTMPCAPGGFVDDCPSPTECRRLDDGAGACLEDPIPTEPAVDEPPPSDGSDPGPGPEATEDGPETATYGCGVARGEDAGAQRAGAWLLVALALGVTRARRRRGR